MPIQSAPSTPMCIRMTSGNAPIDTEDSVRTHGTITMADESITRPARPHTRSSRWLVVHTWQPSTTSTSPPPTDHSALQNSTPPIRWQLPKKQLALGAQMLLRVRNLHPRRYRPRPHCATTHGNALNDAKGSARKAAPTTTAAAAALLWSLSSNSSSSKKQQQQQKQHQQAAAAATRVWSLSRNSNSAAVAAGLSN